jgi:hypothetical protein
LPKSVPILQNAHATMLHVARTLGHAMRAVSFALIWFLAFLPVAIIQRTDAQTPPNDNQLRINTAVQDALIWTGHYDGLADGDIGERSIAAITAFKRDQGWTPAGDLEPDQKLHLFKVAESYRQSYDFRLVNDGRTTLSVPMPLGLVRWQSATPHRSRYTSPSGEIEIILSRYRPDKASLQDRFQDVPNWTALKTITMRVLRRDAFFVSGENASQDLYITARVEGPSVRGLRITTPRTQRPQLARVIVAMASAFHYGMADYAAVATLISPPSRPPEFFGYTARRFLTRDQLLPIVSAFMAEAGISKFKILPPHVGNPIAKGGVGSQETK